MTGQYDLEKEEIQQIRKILDNHNIDLDDDEVSINCSSLREYDLDEGEEPFMEEKFYIQTE